MIPVNEHLIGSDEIENAIECLETGWISSEGHFIREFKENRMDYSSLTSGMLRSFDYSPQRPRQSHSNYKWKDNSCPVKQFGCCPAPGRGALSCLAAFGRPRDQRNEEAHTMRFFFSMELGFLLFTCGFRLESLTAVPSFEQPADETTWDVLGVAKLC